MANRGLRVLTSALRTARENANQYQQLQSAKAKNQMAQERFKLEKQKLEADIELKKRNGEISAMQAQNLKETIKRRNQFQKSKVEYENQLFNTAEDRNRKEAKNIGRLMRTYTQRFSTDSKGNISETYGYTEKPQSKSSMKPTDVDQTLGELDSGERYDKFSEKYMPFENMEEMEKYASRKLGYGWEEKFPQAKEIIDNKFPTQDLTTGVKAGVEAGMSLGKQSAPEGKIMVERPDGQRGYIPSDKLDIAKKQGFKIIK